MPAYADPFGGNDLERFYLNSTPDAGYQRWLEQFNLGGFGGRAADWSQRQQGRYYNQFLSAAGREPTLGFYDWLLGQRNPNLDFQTQSPDERGEGQYRQFTPRSRWIMGGY